MEVLEVKDMALVEGEKSQIDKLKAKLVVSNTYRDFSLPLYKETEIENRLWIPRALVKQPADNANWERIEVKSMIDLRPVQKEIVETFLSQLENYPCGGIISAGTGTGKTIIGIELACRLGLKTLVVVPTERIFVQWRNRIKSFTDAKEVGIIRGYKCEINAPFVVGMLHTLAKSRYDYLREEFGTVIYDEVHTVSTEYFHTVVQKFWSKYSIGLSATPRRKDGMENVFFYHIGRILANYNAVEVKPRFIIVRYYNPRTHHAGCITKNGELNIGRYINRVSENGHRNKVIAKYVRQAYKKGHQVLVLTERLSQIEELIKKCNLPANDVGRLTAQKKEVDKQVIFGTYGSAGLGFDLPTLTCLVLATPRADIVQAVGRITRRKNRQPIVIDFVDEASPIMEKWFQKRLRFYKTLSDEIIYLSEGVG